MRHKLLAHGDASAMTRPDDYPNELVFVNDGKGHRFNMTRFSVEPPFFERMNPLLDALIKKTRYHSDKFADKLGRPLWAFQEHWRVSPQCLRSRCSDLFEANRGRKSYSKKNNPAEPEISPPEPMNPQPSFRLTANGIREKYVCHLEFKNRESTERVVEWLDGVTRDRGKWRLEAEIFELPEGRFKIQAVQIRGGRMYRIS